MIRVATTHVPGAAAAEPGEGSAERSGAYPGLPAETFDFLRRLGSDNTRAWFQDHYGEYEAHVLAPARQLVLALAALLRAVVPAIHAEPRVGGSIGRLYRDARFAPADAPYRTYLFLWFWQGGAPGRECPGFGLRLSAETAVLSAGSHALTAAQRGRFRQAVVDPVRGARLEDALDTVRAAGPYEIGGLHYKRLPEGFDPGHPRAYLLLHNALHAALETPLPAQAVSAEFPAYCFEHYRRLAPVQRWLAEVLLE